MNCKNFLSRIFIVAALVALFATIALGDTIRLKDGSTVKGRITGFSGGKFTVTVGEGTRKREFTFDASEIESIEFDQNEPVETKVAVKNEPVYTETKTSEPVRVIQTEKPNPVEPQKPSISKPTPTGSIAPIVINVNVLADNTANGWTNSGWVVKKGQKIRIIGVGEVSLGKGQKTGPSGSYTLEDESKLLKSVPTGALIAVIGDDNNDFIYVGNDREFVATRDGTLFLGLNEGNLSDNAGSFKVKIEILPGG
ncbi:MAG: LecA/PA-IL family lectin [Pyrinomonadaceae bacterium]